MAQQKTRSRERLVEQAPPLADVLRGALLHRTTFHARGCSVCAQGIGHRQWVLNVNYPGGKNRQISLHRDPLPLVRRQINNFRRLKKTLEAISELNQRALREPSAQRSRRGKRRDESARPSRQHPR